jgi:hypothetical protein
MKYKHIEYTFDENGLKKCNRCKNLYTKDGFYKQSIRKSGYNSLCKSCCAEESKNRYIKSYKKIDYPSSYFDSGGLKMCCTCKNKYQKDCFYLSNKEKSGYSKVCKFCSREKGKNLKYRYPLRNKKNKLKKYGLSIEEYEKMLSSQNGVCSICNKEETRKGKNGKVLPLNVDHCHKTGKVRGLLCHLCNVSLGGFQDSEEILLKAINYLKKYKI